MTKEELAALINGNQYREEISRELQAQAKLNRLVVAFGASDDLLELVGAVDEELSAYEGTTVYFDKGGLIFNECEDENCPHFNRIIKSAATVNSVWAKDNYSWVIESEIPHANFEIFEDDEKYCKGIVFSLDDVPTKTGASNAKV